MPVPRFPLYVGPLSFPSFLIEVVTCCHVRESITRTDYNTHAILRKDRGVSATGHLQHADVLPAATVAAAVNVRKRICKLAQYLVDVISSARFFLLLKFLISYTGIFFDFGD